MEFINADDIKELSNPGVISRQLLNSENSASRRVTITEVHLVAGASQPRQSISEMHISQITQNKKQFLSLLLLADEQEDMIDRYRFFILQVGTGDSPLTIPFYEKCGFKRHHVVKDFFTRNYDHPIFEAGVQIVDMIYLQKPLAQKNIFGHNKKVLETVSSEV